MMNVKRVLNKRNCCYLCALLLLVVLLGPKVMEMLQNNEVIKSAPPGDDSAVADIAEISSANESEPPKDDRPKNGACGSSKEEPPKVDGHILAFDPSGELAQLDVVEPSPASSGLIDKLSAIIG